MFALMSGVIFVIAFMLTNSVPLSEHIAIGTLILTLMVLRPDVIIKQRDSIKRMIHVSQSVAAVLTIAYQTFVVFATSLVIMFIGTMLSIIFTNTANHMPYHVFAMLLVVFLMKDCNVSQVKLVGNYHDGYGH